jgi:hypothetical protein
VAINGILAKLQKYLFNELGSDIVVGDLTLDECE